MTYRTSRSFFLFCLILVIGNVVLPSVQAVPIPDGARSLILDAGNTESEEERLRLLKELRNARDLPHEIKSDLDLLIPCIDRWNDTFLLPYFRPDKEFQVAIEEDSPVYPILALYRGRQLVQHTIAAGGTWGGGWENIDQARDYFRIAAEAFPENRIAGMYLGRPIPSPKWYDPSPQAPEWANLQRESLERLADVIEWWIDHRQQPDGQFRGKWGDDIELWREWIPALFAFEDSKIVAAQERLCRGIWQQDFLELGYANQKERRQEVEHSAEPTGDTLPPMMLLKPEEEEWSEKAYKLSEYMRTTWCDWNERGQFQFKGIYIFPDEVWDESPSDTFYHTRVVHPVALLWLRSGSEELGELITDWMDTWVDITRREENGKPTGVMPSAIHWPSGRVGGETDEWWNPIVYTEHKENYYSYPSQLGPMTKTLLLTYFMTGEDRYLEPIRSTAQLYAEYLTHAPESKLVPGSRLWAASKSGQIVETLAKYRLLTGDTEFDDLLERAEYPYLNYRINRNADSLLKTLRDNVAFQRINFEAHTSELRGTDRLFSYPSVYAHADKKAFPKTEEERRNGVIQYDNTLCYQMATGDPGSPLYFPMMAVRWLTPPRNIAALVEQADATSLRARLFHFDDSARTFQGESYLLEPGSYEVAVSRADNGKRLSSSLLTITESPARFGLSLPGNVECLVSIRSSQ